MCKIDDCERPIETRGWCRRHYKRWLRHGDPLGGGTPHTPGGVVCAIDWCPERAHGRGYCVRHLNSLKRNGHPLVAKRAKESFHFHAGRQRTDTYRAWSHMKGRCLAPGDKRYARYGGRGITVCERWMTFPQFLEDMGECPPGLTLDRIDNDGHYEPGNCRWATRAQQSDNRGNTRRFMFQGELLTMKEIAGKVDMRHSTLYQRLITKGWPFERAVTEPVRGGRNGKHLS